MDRAGNRNKGASFLDEIAPPVHPGAEGGEAQINSPGLRQGAAFPEEPFHFPVLILIVGHQVRNVLGQPHVQISRTTLSIQAMISSLRSTGPRRHFAV
mgnify:CR=1 FL=1